MPSALSCHKCSNHPFYSCFLTLNLALPYGKLKSFYNLGSLTIILSLTERWERYVTTFPKEGCRRRALHFLNVIKSFLLSFLLHPKNSNSLSTCEAVKNKRYNFYSQDKKWETSLGEMQRRRQIKKICAKKWSSHKTVYFLDFETKCYLFFAIFKSRLSHTHTHTGCKNLWIIEWTFPWMFSDVCVCEQQGDNWVELGLLWKSIKSRWVCQPWSEISHYYLCVSIFSPTPYQYEM